MFILWQLISAASAPGVKFPHGGHPRAPGRARGGRGEGLDRQAGATIVTAARRAGARARRRGTISKTPSGPAISMPVGSCTYRRKFRRALLPAWMWHNEFLRYTHSLNRLHDCWVTKKLQCVIRLFIFLCYYPVLRVNTCGQAWKRAVFLMYLLQYYVLCFDQLFFFCLMLTGRVFVWIELISRSF